jgi:hypothetical protein
MTDIYIEKSEAADRIDVITLTMEVILNNFGDDRWIKFLRNGKKIRILVLSPSSSAAGMRGRQEGINLPGKTLGQIEILKNRLYAQAVEQLSNEEYSGSLEVRFYDGIPYFAYFGTEKEIVAGLYYSHVMGLQSEAIYIDARCPVYKKMQSHFNAVHYTHL